MTKDATGIPGFEIRSTTEADAPLILTLIKELAEYERLSDEVVATEESLIESLFGERPSAEVVIGELDGAPIGYALYFHNYSTFVGRAGMYLEDIYVRPEYRGRGFGKALLVYVARQARARGCRRLEWAVLDWNTPSIEFYKGLGAVAMDEWTVFRMTGEALERLAG